MSDKKITLYSPTGQKVQVSEARAEVLKVRGYTTKKAAKPAPQSEPSSDEDKGPEDADDKSEADAQTDDK